MRVLASVYVCAKEAGSEPEIGYTTVVAAARAGHQITVLTWAGHADPLRRDLAGDGVLGVRVIAVEGPARLDRFVGRRGLGHVHYLAWQAKVARLARRMEADFDVAHHVTFGSDWMPCGLHALRSTPVVWGPIGGQAPIPWAIAPYLGARGLVQEAAREVLTRAGRAVAVAVAAGAACLVVAHNQDTAAWYGRRGLAVIVQPLVAMPPVVDHEGERRRGSSSGRRVVFVGRLTPWKGCLLSVRTLAELPPSWTLDLYGSGRARCEVERLADRLGIAARVQLMGHRPKEEVWAALRQADALLLPSLHDSAPQPVAQAVRSGCPVVCLDVAGPPELAGDGGVAVPLGRRLPLRLAAAVLQGRRFPPDNRWSAERLPGVLDDIYDRATRLRPGSAPVATSR